MTIKNLKVNEFIQMIGLEDDVVLENINEVVTDYNNISKIVNERKNINYIIFADEVSKDDRMHLRKYYIYNGLLNNYLLGYYI